ncbi:MULTISPECIES: hypothetical protein [Rhodomicrobium]|uniref:hypothetical protein n=1 Tax=Rhodomicrobium TaxID=1068 RepID=UPI000F737015|nr:MULTISPECIES: hypothetical protein [Rhodomicrobium]
MKITCLALACTLIAAPAFAQTQPSVTLPPPADKTATPAPEEKPAPANPDAKPTPSDKQGNETGWGGNWKTDDEGKADPKRNEVQGQPK